MQDYTAIMSSLNAYRLPGRANGGLASVVRFESRTGVRLPAAYRDFVASWGLSAFEGYVAFPIRGNPPFGGQGLVSVFFGFQSGDGYDLHEMAETYVGRLPSGLLPVAEDPGSNLVCLEIAGTHPGRVWFWDHESEGADDAAWLIADSWDDFMNALSAFGRS